PLGRGVGQSSLVFNPRPFEGTVPPHPSPTPAVSLGEREPPLPRAARSLSLGATPPLEAGRVLPEGPSDAKANNCVGGRGVSNWRTVAHAPPSPQGRGPG